MRSSWWCQRNSIEITNVIQWHPLETMNICKPILTYFTGLEDTLTCWWHRRKSQEMTRVGFLIILLWSWMFKKWKGGPTSNCYWYLSLENGKLSDWELTGRPTLPLSRGYKIIMTLHSFILVSAVWSECIRINFYIDIWVYRITPLATYTDK